MVMRPENASQVVWSCLRPTLGILAAAIVGSFCGLLGTSLADEPHGVNAPAAKIYRTSGQPSVADEEKAIRKLLDENSDGDVRLALLIALVQDYFDADDPADARRVMENIVDDEQIPPGRRSLTASGLALAYALENDFVRSQRLVNQAKKLADQTPADELETLPEEPAYEYLSAEAELARRALNQHDTALRKVREAADLARKNLNNPSLSEHRHEEAANQLLDESEHLVLLLTQNNRRTEALNYANGMLWDIDHDPRLKPRAVQRALVEVAVSIALMSNDDYDGALFWIDKAIKGYQDAGVLPYAFTYAEALRMRLMIALATNRLADYKADADAFAYAASVNPVVAKTPSSDERLSVILATQGNWPGAESSLSHVLTYNLMHQGAQSPFVKYQSAMQMLYRLEDPERKVSEGDISRYVTPMLDQNDDWDASSSAGAFVEDGALAMCLSRLTDDGEEGQALAFRIAELFHMNATQGAMSDGAVRLAAVTPELRSLVEHEQMARHARDSERLGFSGLTTPFAKDDTENAGNKGSAIASVTDAEKTMNASAGDLATLHDRINKQFPEYRRLVSSAVPTPEQVGAALHSGEVYVDFYVGRDATYAFVVNAKGSLHATRLNVTRTDLKKQIVTLRKAFDAGVPPRKAGDLAGFDTTTASDLYRLLISSIEPDLEGATTVYIATSGILSSLPFDVLVTAPATDLASAHWWIANTMPVRIPNASALVLARSHPATHASEPLIAFADPSFDGRNPTTNAGPSADRTPARAFPVDAGTASFDYHRVAPLPDTLDEATSIAKTLNASDHNVLWGTSASRSEVMKRDLLNDRVVLFATHGIVAGEVPGWHKAGLALAYEGSGLPDSVLTADDIVTLRLNADWVVLSACNTGLVTGNAGDAMSELSRAFFAAGARSILLTQWAVESRSATEVTTGVFRTYANDPSLSKAEALARTERDMASGKDGELYRHPYFWGAYVLAGDAAR
ncbi:CHAT domain-containing protein [Paraburkholderia sp. CNPSo 3281]|uniref:CHAT domain-containing protein n=1 Tax=Paraburkholderia sp. CNPSo 3281 TaxID=2940933 RepID=UPI0020B75348|nr:CHAT domain-containing protein [Paraburkholderia sp. CNPSo 3281]MCP3715446.1 CHAT domain-containing protein [Paraburkholderia sp. CNPSo 3281]